MAITHKVVTSEVSFINCRQFFVMNWKSFKLLGIITPKKNIANNSSQQLPRIMHLMWTYFINITVTCLFPMHLMLGVFNTEATKSELFESVAISTTSLGAALKLIVFAYNIKNIRKMEHTLQNLDESIHHAEDQIFFTQHIKRPLIYMERMYVTVYVAIGIFAGLACITRWEQKLIYPGWLPFNWHKSWWHYIAALCFQINGIFFQIVQNLTTDSFSPKALCILSGHIKLLYKRVSRIGYDGPLMFQHHELELNRCVTHQIVLYKLFDTIQEIISWPLFLQLFVSLVNLGVAMVALVFFVTDIFYRIYYFMYFLGMILQLLPVCYYGSYFVILFENLHYAVFSCNWTGQSKRFKSHMILFTERSLKITMTMAGGMFPIHLATFFATCKGAYSMFTVIITMK